MKVLVVGGGGREHALALSVSNSPLVKELEVAPGNAGTESIGKSVSLNPTDVDALRSYCQETEPDLVIIGPEAPLAAGAVDVLAESGVTAFGPGREAAAIEASKVFAKEFMQRHAIPTADFEVFSDPREATRYLDGAEYPLVVKADGLAAGKGSIVCGDKGEALKAVERIMVNREFGASGDRVVIESFLSGEEASILAFTDGKDYLTMIPSQDHKRAYDGDQGPNTGGMGAYAPAPVVSQKMLSRINEGIIEPTVEGLSREGIVYKGILYAGLMITAEGPKVVEFNCRFGDPETQAVLPLLDTDLVEIMMAVVEGKLGDYRLEWKTGSSLCVVMASGGYPLKYETGYPITGLDKVTGMPGVLVYHAGTKISGGEIVTAGGRVLNVVAVGRNLKDAYDKAYQAVGEISFKNCFFRRDIGFRALQRTGHWPA